MNSTHSLTSLLDKHRTSGPKKKQVKRLSLTSDFSHHCNATAHVWRYNVRWTVQEPAEPKYGRRPTNKEEFRKATAVRMAYVTW